MSNNDYQTTITVKASPEIALERIAQVQLWWAKDFRGTALREGDVFSVHFGSTFVDFRVEKFVPRQKVSWLVTDCNLDWIENKKEWNGTEVVFDVSEKGDRTQVRFTHVGLVPSVECYADCEAGWNNHFAKSLVQLIEQGEGAPM